MADCAFRGQKSKLLTVGPYSATLVDGTEVRSSVAAWLFQVFHSPFQPKHPQDTERSRSEKSLINLLGHHAGTSNSKQPSAGSEYSRKNDPWAPE
uniref:Uncharacterized protein n=1 Tax=Ascaris lumbricoides TaxID=6252 RepID=A0A0M3HNL9_ASCLU